MTVPFERLIVSPVSSTISTACSDADTNAGTTAALKKTDDAKNLQYLVMTLQNM